MGRRPFDATKVKPLSQFGLGQSRVDREAEEKLKKEAELREMTPYRIPSSDIGQGFSMEEGINPWEVSMPDVPIFLICPGCGADVEEDVIPEVCKWKPDGNIVAGSVPGQKSAFCYCLNPKCNGIRYFMVELVRMKSWRREFSKDVCVDILPETC